MLIILSFYGKIYFKVFKFNINIKVSMNILKYCIHIYYVYLLLLHLFFYNALVNFKNYTIINQSQFLWRKYSFTKLDKI